MDRNDLIRDLCKEADIPQPRGKTEHYLSRRTLSDLLLSLRRKNDELTELRNKNATTKTKAERRRG